MKRTRRDLSITLAIAALLLLPPPAGAALGRQQKVYLIAGYGASNRIDNVDWYRKRLQNFSGQKVFPLSGHQCLNREQFLKAAAKADILFFSGHSGVPSARPDIQALKLKPTATNADGLISAADLRAGLRGGGPRLVIVNGCKTTDPADGIAEAKRIHSGFGISQGTRGRAYLGWPKLVVGFVADDQMGRFLTAWTKPNADGTYPSLADAKRTLGIQNLTIIGDSSLRYPAPPPGGAGHAHDLVTGADVPSGTAPGGTTPGGTGNAGTPPRLRRKRSSTR